MDKPQAFLTYKINFNQKLSLWLSWWLTLPEVDKIISKSVPCITQQFILVKVII